MTAELLSGTPLPLGTVTLMFTDIQGSTKLLQRLGDGYGSVLTMHRNLVRDIVAARGGTEVDTQGDAFFIAFPDANKAVRAAIDCQEALINHPWDHGEPLLVRMGLHTGTPTVVDGHYVGIDVHLGARICSAGHGGQIVTSRATIEALETAVRAELELADLGSHRLKDLDEPEDLFQVTVPGSEMHFPALRSITPPTNVPLVAGDLIGRVHELQELRDLVLEQGARLITLSGPGGSGKTRVAAALTLDMLDHFSHGAFFVDLSAISDATQVGPSITEVLGMTVDTTDDPADSLAELIGTRRMLLVLDNFEHVLEAATLVSDLVGRCPGLRILVTSRAILSVRGEQEYPVPPLGLPATSGFSDVARSDAVQMFVQSASRARPGFELREENAEAITGICGLLDGLPLAIELASARVKIFEPSDLLVRLDDHLRLLTASSVDAPARHRALRATIDWSYDLLEPEQRFFFRDFSVFRGGATIESIEQVLGSDIETFDSLTALVNSSLIRRRESPDGEPRFTMLQTILAYARELLDTAQETRPVKDRHAESFAAKAESTPEAISEDYENMTAALEWLGSIGETDRDAAALGLRLAAALGSHWYRHGEAQHGSETLVRFLDLAPDALPATRANALRRLGVLFEQLREPDQATAHLEEALSIYRELDDRSGEAACLNSLGIVSRTAGHLGEAQILLTRALDLRRAIGDEEGESATLSNLGVLAVDRAELDAAGTLLEQSMAIDKRRGDTWGAACTACNLGVVRIEQGDPGAGRLLVADAINTFADLEDMDGLASCLEAMASSHIYEGHFESGARMEGAAHAVRSTHGLPPDPAEFERKQAWLDRAKGAMGEAAYEVAFAEGGEMTTQQAIAYALDKPTPLP